MFQFPTINNSGICRDPVVINHIEMAIWDTIGDFLDCSGWTAALCEAGVATSGIADYFLKASHLTRTRRAHQITALTLTKLRRQAWLNMMSLNAEMSFEKWREDMAKKSPTFMYWDLVLEFEILALIFVRAHRSNDFNLFVESLEALVPWFFALDHINYSRWIPIHICDMKSLPSAVNEDLAQFWVLQKTSHKFSCMPIDQGHEQNNKLVKGSGGAVGLFENPVALKRWMVAGPEQARLLTEFESQFMKEEDFETAQQHEQGLASQELFKKHANMLYETMSIMGNPFEDDIPELLVLDSHSCATADVIDTVRNIKAIGQSQYQDYVADVVVDRKSSIHKPIKKNRLPLFKRRSPKASSRNKQQIASLKSDCNLFSYLYIASKFRDGDLEDFFSHENHPWPSSLSEHGKIRLPSKKSDLLSQLDSGISEPSCNFDAKVFDGAAIVHMLPTKQATTFVEYGIKVFVPWTQQQLQNCNRIDVVWDRYVPQSLKESTREKRGTGTRRKVRGQTKLPTNFPNFLRDPMNKTELFEFLTEVVATCDYTAGKEVYITSGMSFNYY